MMIKLKSKACPILENAVVVWCIGWRPLPRPKGMWRPRFSCDSVATPRWRNPAPLINRASPSRLSFRHFRVFAHAHTPTSAFLCFLPIRSFPTMTSRYPLRSARERTPPPSRRKSASPIAGDYIVPETPRRGKGDENDDNGLSDGRPESLSDLGMSQSRWQGSLPNRQPDYDDGMLGDDDQDIPGSLAEDGDEDFDPEENDGWGSDSTAPEVRRQERMNHERARKRAKSSVDPRVKAAFEEHILPLLKSNRKLNKEMKRAVRNAGYLSQSAATLLRQSYQKRRVSRSDLRRDLERKTGKPEGSIARTTFDRYCTLAKSARLERLPINVRSLTPDGNSEPSSPLFA